MVSLIRKIKPLSLKADVRLRFLSPQMALGAQVVASAYWQLGLGCVITAGSDGEHMARSLHYKGNALDFRIHTIPKRKRPALAKAVREALGRDFDVVLEATHLHVEYDPA